MGACPGQYNTSDYNIQLILRLCRYSIGRLYYMLVAFLFCQNSVPVGSPNVTGLTYNNQSRTFTCTSTGGPATTVIWRRNGAVITLKAACQQTQRLVDPVNGTYQTVLIIDPSVGWSDTVGTYNCTVQNDRGESSETVIVTGET